MTGSRDSEEIGHRFLAACEGRTFISFRELSERLGISVDEIIARKLALEAYLKTAEPDSDLTSRVDLDPPGFEIRD